MFPTVSQGRPKRPPGAPRSGPKAGQVAPRTVQSGPGPPPGRPKIAYNATGGFKSTPFGTQGRPKSRPRGLRRPFWSLFSLVLALFFVSLSALLVTCVAMFSGLKALNKHYGHSSENTGKTASTDTTRWAGGDIPTWPGEARGGQGRPGEARHGQARPGEARHGLAQTSPPGSNGSNGFIALRAGTTHAVSPMRSLGSADSFQNPQPRACAAEVAPEPHVLMAVPLSRLEAVAAAMAAPRRPRVGQGGPGESAWH